MFSKVYNKHLLLSSKHSVLKIRFNYLAAEMLGRSAADDMRVNEVPAL